uniref:hypothetical protein n=1 Tax=Enterocloster clostridioformis TaxID=1531 RepID=UPI0026E2988B
MVYGVINKKGESWYTQMGKVFDAIDNKQKEYNWLITDIDGGAPEKIWEYCNDGEDFCWLTGEQLSEIVREQDVQWVWAVLSGFDKNISLSEILAHPHPYADGYRGFWENPLSIQHPLASVEIVAWDSSLTLCFSRNEELVRDFLNFFPLSEDLAIYLS